MLSSIESRRTAFNPERPRLSRRLSRRRGEPLPRMRPNALADRPDVGRMRLLLDRDSAEEAATHGPAPTPVFWSGDGRATSSSTRPDGARNLLIPKAGARLYWRPCKKLTSRRSCVARVGLGRCSRARPVSPSSMAPARACRPFDPARRHPGLEAARRRSLGRARAGRSVHGSGLRVRYPGNVPGGARSRGPASISAK